MKKFTGFRAYWVMNLIRHAHYAKKSTFDIMECRRLPWRDRYIGGWNNKVSQKYDGKVFYDIDKKFPKRYDLYKLYSFYYMDNPKFYVFDILNDEFSLYKKYNWQLENAERSLTSDILKLYTFCVGKNKPFEWLFKPSFSKPAPIFKIYAKNKIGLNSFMAFDHVYNLSTKINMKNLNLIEAEKAKKMKMVLTNYKKIVFNKYYDFDIKKLIEYIITN